MSSAYPGLEFGNFVIRQGVCLGDNRDKVDFGVKAAHKLNIEGLQPTGHLRYEHLFWTNETYTYA